MDCQLIHDGNHSWWCPECDPEQKRLLPHKARRNCHLPPDPEDIAFRFEAIDNLPEDVRKDAAEAVALANKTPELRKRVDYYLIALERWSKAGFPLRSMELAEQCRQVCLNCPSEKYDASKDLCKVCGCKVAVSRWIPITSKPRMATEKCPKGHWPK